MYENGFYLIKQELFDLIENIGGKYTDKKLRPVYCCIKDRYIENLYWAIPTSDISHRTQQQMNKINKYAQLPRTDIRSAYFHVGHTNKPALYKISNCFPITDKYIERAYLSQGKPLCLKNKQEIRTIQEKLLQILSYEGRFPNRLEQHITDTKSYLINELQFQLNQSILPNQIPSVQNLSEITQSH